MSIEKLDLQSPDLVKENIQKIAELFPQCVTESAEGRKIDFEKLQQELQSDVIGENKERYRLEWPGKREAIVNANLPTTSTLRPIRGESVDFDSTENLYIEGDNLEVLKLLQESYLGKIKMIYIDPPYNTGKDFVYSDNFTQGTEEYKQESGQVDNNKNRLFVNPETSGRYHSDWLSMMYPRLKLARNLLTDDGVIFISIDDNEVHNLRKVCDEIFGEGNFVGNIVWQKRTSPDARKKLSTGHEYSLCYIKDNINSENAFTYLSLNEKDKLNYRNPDNDQRGPWVSTDFGAQGYRPNQMYTIVTPGGKEYVPSEGRCWKNTEDMYKKLISENRMWFGLDGCGVPRKKLYLAEREGKNIWTWWPNIEVGHTQEATQNLTEILGKKTIFEYSKPVRYSKRMIEINSVNKEFIILDFFSGSATTAHAVMQLNSEDGGKRKFIMVQIPEPTDEKSEAYKAGYKNICEIGKERIRRAGKKIKEGVVDAPLESEDDSEEEDSEKLDFSQVGGVSRARATVVRSSQQPILVLRVQMSSKILGRVWILGFVYYVWIPAIFRMCTTNHRSINRTNSNFFLTM
jgi:adenine-specific DNA-methyltransferase